MGKPADWVPEARKLREAGMSYKDIAAKFNKSVTVVFQKTSPQRDAYAILDLGTGTRRALGFSKKPTIAEAEEFLKLWPDFIKDFEMSDRQFQKVSLIANGTRRDALRIECSKKLAPDCLLHEEFYNKSGSATSVVHAATVFRNHGWIVGGGPRADICPKCYHFITEKQREDQRAKKMSNANVIEVGAAQVNVQPNIPTPFPTPLPTPTPAPPPAPPPAPKPAIPVSQLTLKDVDKTAKRIIDDKLDDVYEAGKGGYINGYSDEKVASELNTMVEWVALVRDFGHGPNTSNADISEDIKAIDKALSEVREAKRLVDAGVERMTELDKALNIRLADFEKKSAEFQTLYNQVKARLGNLI
jgi:hypothetical protein